MAGQRALGAGDAITRRIGARVLQGRGMKFIYGCLGCVFVGGVMLAIVRAALQAYAPPMSEAERSKR